MSLPSVIRIDRRSCRRPHGKRGDMSFGVHRLLPLLSERLGHSANSVSIQALRTYAAAAGSMALVKDLREKSGAPIQDVKSALVEANWDPGECLCSGHGLPLTVVRHLDSTVYVNCRVCLPALAQKGVGSCLQKGIYIVQTPHTRSHCYFVYVNTCLCFRRHAWLQRGS